MFMKKERAPVTAAPCITLPQQASAEQMGPERLFTDLDLLISTVTAYGEEYWADMMVQSFLKGVAFVPENHMSGFLSHSREKLGLLRRRVEVFFEMGATSFFGKSSSDQAELALLQHIDYLLGYCDKFGTLEIQNSLVAKGRYAVRSIHKRLVLTAEPSTVRSMFKHFLEMLQMLRTGMANRNLSTVNFSNLDDGSNTPAALELAPKTALPRTLISPASLLQIVRELRDSVGSFSFSSPVEAFGT